MMILIKELSDEEFQVIVNAKNPTSHNVTLTYDTHQNLTNGKVSKKELIEFSFKFLWKENLILQFYPHLN